MERTDGIIWSPSDLIAVFNQTFETAYPVVEVEGELANFKVNQGKFVFFDIKDQFGVLSCFMMLFQLRQALEDGMMLRVKARPVVTKFGKLSLTVSSLSLVGEGSIKKSQALLKEKLSKEGLFAVERKRPLPSLPSSIAVISSRDAAGFADFQRILAERWGALKIVFKHTQVQGDSAPDQIIKAIEQINQLLEVPELIAIVRGGGSPEDLACFNDEKLVRAIASSRIPIITGIGHEIDESLCDLAADSRGATPSHVAQMIVPDAKDFLARLNLQLKQAKETSFSAIEEEALRNQQKLDEIKRIVKQKISDLELNLQSFNSLLDSYNPQNVLERGYAILRGEIEVGKTLKIETKDRLIETEVKNVHKK